MNDLLVKGGTLFDVGRPVETGDILVRDGRIVEIAPVLSARDATVFEARGKIVMPGFVNAHTHSNQALEKTFLEDRAILEAVQRNRACNSEKLPQLNLSGDAVTIRARRTISSLIEQERACAAVTCS